MQDVAAPVQALPDVHTPAGIADEDTLNNLRDWLHAIEIGKEHPSPRAEVPLPPQSLSPSDSGPSTPANLIPLNNFNSVAKHSFPAVLGSPAKIAPVKDVDLGPTPPRSDSVPSLEQDDIVVVGDNLSQQTVEPRDANVLSSLTAEDVHFAIVDQEGEQPSLKQLRERIIKEYPQLIDSAPEPVAKPRKAHAPPPAVDQAVRARFKQMSKEERELRERSLTVHIESEVEQSVIKGVIVMESREGHWEKLQVPVNEPSTSSQASPPEVAELPILPSVWLLPIDTRKMLSQHKKKSKSSLELPDYRVTTKCWQCHGQGSRTCKSCAGVAADECFWCDGSGIRRGKTCEGCNGKKNNECATCSNSGTCPCSHCDATGKVVATYVIEVKLRTVELPPISTDSLVDPITGHVPETAEDVADCARAKMVSTVHRITQEQARKSKPSVPVLAKCVWTKNVQRIVGVWRPYRVSAPGLLRRRSSAKVTTIDDVDLSDIDEDGPDSNGELRKFVVPSDRNAPVLELLHDARPNSSRSASRRGSRVNTPLHSPGLSPTPSFANLASLWRNGGRSRKNSATNLRTSPDMPPSASPSTPETPQEAITPSSSWSTYLSSGASGTPGLAATSSPGSKPISRKSSFASIIPKRRKSNPADTRVPVPPLSPLTPASPAPWMTRRGSATPTGGPAA